MKDIYIITGATGFLGNNIIKKLSINENNEIRCLVLPNDKIDSLNKKNIKIYYGDITKKDSLDEIFTAKNSNVYVIHCAGMVYIKTKYNPLVYEINVNGTKNIAEKTKEINGKLIYINSVHGIPEKENNETITETENFDKDKVIGLYAKTKAEAAKIVLKMIKEEKLNACIIHPSGLIGPGDTGNSHLTELIKRVATKKLKISIKGGYDFVDVRDVANGIISACKNGKTGNSYILSNKYYTIKEIMNMVCEVAKIDKIKKIIPMWIPKLFAPIIELYYNAKKKTPLFTSYSLYTLQSNSNFSHKKATKELNYKTRDMKKTILDTYNFLKLNNNLNI